MSKELERVIARLSQKSKPLPVEVEPEPEPEGDDPTEELEQELEGELENENPPEQYLPPMPTPQQEVRARGRPPTRPPVVQTNPITPTQPPITPVEEVDKNKKVQEVDTQIESLQNNGLFRVELLYQIQIQNEFLKRISETLGKLIEEEDGNQ